MINLLRTAICSFGSLHTGELFVSQHDHSLGIRVTGEIEGVLRFDQMGSTTMVRWADAEAYRGVTCLRLARRGGFSLETRMSCFLDRDRSFLPVHGSVVIGVEQAWICCSDIAEKGLFPSMTLVDINTWHRRDGSVGQGPLVVNEWSLVVEGKSALDFRAAQDQRGFRSSSLP